MDMDILEQYKNVFKDCIECLMEGMDDEERPTLSKEQIDCIVERLIYKSDYMWETIDDTIYSLIEREVEKND